MSIDTISSHARKIIGYSRWAITVSLICVLVVIAPRTFAATTNISDYPLSMGGNVPGNLALVPSVEFPTILSAANIGNFDVTKKYAGYFDSLKCYKYVYSATESERHFTPSSITATMTCSGSGEWSGNYLNWAATQTVDPFRKALTGGYRVKDTASETWLEKARFPASRTGTWFANRRVPTSGDNSTLVGQVSPLSWNYLNTRVERLENKLYFTQSGTISNNTATAYNPATSLSSGTVYEVSVRVKVCDISIGLESNCRQYSGGWKPEGLLQDYADDIRYSVFGYLNDSDPKRDGGVLRAQQKYIGKTRLTNEGKREDNPNKEWDPTTGVFIQNPDSADAASTTTTIGTTISNSGVMNYLNKFGQMTSATNKSYDPVSELYYTAIRYFKKQGNVPEYSTISSTLSTTDKYKYADGFPVITNWNDPIQYTCQPNIILGIGDVYTHRDKNLPGTTRTVDEPSMPTTVSSDTTIDVDKATQKVAELEGITINTPFTGRENSAYMVGLAYDSHTKDIRPDLSGTTTVSTYWVDVLENQNLEPINRNQYWLAAKYGGFTVPDGYSTYGATAADIPLTSWYTTTDTLTPTTTSTTPFQRTDNYYTAGNASNMVEGLKDAFYSISLQSTTSSAAIATNSTRLDAGTFVYQARYNSGDWSGHLYAFAVNSDGTVNDDVASGDHAWDAANGIPAHGSRKVFTYNGSTGIEFLYSKLSPTQSSQLGATATIAQNVVNYLRGDDSNEVKNGGLFRDRTIRLGDIINSDPWFVGTENFGYNTLPGTEGDVYTDFRWKTSYQTRTQMLYVGANDGMLHGINANTGNEVFAYIPMGVFSNLANLAKPNYSHQFFVDAGPRAGDAYIDTDNSGTKEWATILVGATGAGGKSVFALDVTTPDSFTEANVLWEFGYADQDCVAGVTACREIGYTIGQPSILRLATGTWVAVFGNGYNSASQTARLFIVDLETGKLIQAIDTGVGDATTPNGLATPVSLDIEGDHIADYAYAGDLRGNLWKFDLTAATADIPIKVTGKPAPLFTAVGPNNEVQPITAKPQVADNPDGGYIVYFGTGKYFEVGDNFINSPADVQSFYGIFDTDQVSPSPVKRSELLKQEISYENSYIFTDGSGNMYLEDIRLVTQNTPTLGSTFNGWYIDLLSPQPANLGRQGERVVSMPLIWSDRVIFTTLIPDANPCNSEAGDSWLMELDPYTGGQLAFTVFDLNHDGKYSNAELDTVLKDGNQVIVSGRKSKEGIIKTPGVVCADTECFKYFSGSSGSIEVTPNNTGANSGGRQSWEQLK